MTYDTSSVVCIFSYRLYAVLDRSWKKQSTDVCFNIHTPTGRDLHVDAFGMTCWLKHSEYFVFYHFQTLYRNMMKYARICPVCFSTLQAGLDGKVIHQQEDTHMLNVFNHLEYIGIACFLKDFQHGTLNPWNPRFGCHFRVILRRPPPLREEARFWWPGEVTHQLRIGKAHLDIVICWYDCWYVESFFRVALISMTVLCEWVDVNEMENGNNKEIFQERYSSIEWVTQITGCKVPCKSRNHLLWLGCYCNPNFP